MKIIRNEAEITLTSEELRLAYEEQQHLYDKEDIEMLFDQTDDDDLVDNYGLARSGLEILVDDMAYRMRKYIDKYDMNWQCARDEAIKNIIAEVRAED